MTRSAPAESFQTRSLSEHIGVEVLDYDFARDFRPDRIDEIRRLADTHLVVLFRGQPLTEEQHVAFTAELGEPIYPTESTFSSRTNPMILRLGNVDFDGTHLDADAPMTRYFVSAENWHSDGSYKPTPNYLTTLHSLEIPPEGGETWFASMIAAFAALEPAKQDFLRGRMMIHPYVHGNSKIKNWTGVDLEPACHPVVRKLPDGREALFLSSYPGAQIVGMEADASAELVDELFAFATQPRFMYKHRWRLADTLIWNNRGLIHQAQYYDRKYRRLLQRTETVSENQRVRALAEAAEAR